MTLDKDLGRFHKHFRCGRALWIVRHGSKNLFKSNTIQAQEDITVSGLKAGNTRAKLYIIFGRFIKDFSGFVNSFGLAPFVAHEHIIVLLWIPAGCSRKSI